MKIEELVVLKESVVGPELSVAGEYVRCWLGTSGSDDAHELAARLRCALRKELSDIKNRVK